MIKKIHFLFGLMLAVPAMSYGMVGGPFDGGDYSQTLDNSGIYQATMRFSNGVGYQQWGVNVSLAPTVNASGAGSGASTALKLGSVLDRSVVYYKGIVYVGNATGIVDHNKGTISGITNGYSSLSASASAQNGAGSSTVTASTIVVNNGTTDAVANSEFAGTINAKAPVLTFSGSGELTVLNPTQNSTLSGSLYSALQQLIAAIPAAATATPVTGTQNLITSVVNAINNIQSGAVGGIIPAPDTTTADTTPMKVFGSRVFFLGTR